MLAIKLAQKYRPSIFEDVIGQDSVVKVLKAIIRLNRFESAYLFSGPPGVGKTTLGRIFSKASLCESPVDGNPCCKCESCLLFMEERNFGYQELDAASFGGKEDMVKLRDEASMLAAVKRKVILLDESHDISRQGQNALLKQVEECPEHLIYIFCTTEPDKMEKTLRDRCIHFQISKIDPQLINNRLKKICDSEKIPFEEEAITMIASKSDGHMRNAINLLEEIAYLGSITVDYFKAVSKDYEEEIFELLCNLGTDLSKSLDIYKNVSSCISSIAFYNTMLTLVSDASKYIYGYDKFTPRYLNMVSKLKDIHGHSLIEFMNYLITRDKYIDRIGISSDIIIMHNKFCSSSFVPKEIKVDRSPVIINTQQPTQIISQKQDPSNDASPLSYAQLLKMGFKDRSKILREQKRSQKSEQLTEKEIVPSEWPLPKEERVGENSLDDDILSPQEFSQYLVGGRGSA